MKSCNNNMLHLHQVPFWHYFFYYISYPCFTPSVDLNIIICRQDFCNPASPHNRKEWLTKSLRGLTKSK